MEEVGWKVIDLIAQKDGKKCRCVRQVGATFLPKLYGGLAIGFPFNDKANNIGPIKAKQKKQKL
jgi:hypothetical protein